jgi:hypothetical protein
VDIGEDQVFGRAAQKKVGALLVLGNRKQLAVFESRWIFSNWRRPASSMALSSLSCLGCGPMPGAIFSAEAAATRI